MAGRVAKKGAVKSAVKPAGDKGGAAKAVVSRTVNKQPEAKKRVTSSVGKTTPLKKPGLYKVVHELQVRQAELETQNKDLHISQEQLQASQERYFDLYDIAPVGYFSISEKGIILEVNITGANLLGGVPGDMRAQRFFNFIYEEDQDIYQQHRNKLFETLSPQACEVRMVRKDGTLVWVLVEGIVAKDARNGKAVFLATMSDITRQKKAEEALRASEEKYQLLADNTVDGIWLLDMNLKLIYCSPASEKQSGFTLQEIMEMPLEQYFTPESLKVVTEAFLEAIPKAEADPAYNPVLTLELEFYKKDGTAFWAESKFSIIRDKRGKPESILGVARDITERKLVEESLRESESQYRLLSEHIMDVVVLLDMNLKFIYVSPSVEKMRGFTSLEAMKLPLEKHLTPESLKLAAELFLGEIPRTQADPGYNPVPILDLEYYCKDGTTRWGEGKFSIIRDSSGRPVSILGEIRDITERRRAEEALRASEAQYRLLSEHMTDTIRLIDMNLKTTYVSPSAEKQRGFTHREMLELPLEKQLTPESLRVAVGIFSEELPRVNFDPGYNPVHTLDLEYYCKDGTTVWAESKFSVIRDENGKPVSILAEARDITERRLAEDKLAKSYESLKKTLNDAINTMVKIVELRDPYTAGHQQKVADLATAIAGEMKLADTQIDQIRTAAVIHDIGKMYVPSDILSKPGKLSNIEFSLIKTHSQSGYNIVKGMDLPCSVADAVLQHHERLDGSGYPRGLKGEDMILEAKILAVADVIEAMTSHRPYRPTLGIEKALEEISNNGGKLYDPGVVDACLELFNSHKFEFKPV